MRLRYLAPKILILALLSHFGAQADLSHEPDEMRIEMPDLIVEGVILDAGYEESKDRILGMMVVKKVIHGQARIDSTLFFSYLGHQPLNPGDKVAIDFIGDADSLMAQYIKELGNVFTDRKMPIPKSHLPQRSRSWFF